MKKQLFSLIAALILVTSLGVSAATPSFTDVPLDNPHYTAIEYCATNNFMRGKGGGMFSPNGTFTRAEFITMWARTFHARMHNFIDATKTKNEADNAILLMYGLGYVNGTSANTFTHSPVFNRESVAKLIENTYLQGIASNDEYKNYTDWASISSWARDAVSVCYQKGLFEGIAGATFNPSQPITRGEACEIIMRLMKKAPEPPTMYTITVAPMENGSVTPNKVSAAAGETITLTVTPTEGFELTAGSLKYDETEIQGTSFEMPAKNVVISALFEAAVEEPDPSPSPSEDP